MLNKTIKSLKKEISEQKQLAIQITQNFKKNKKLKWKMFIGAGQIRLHQQQRQIQKNV